MRQRCLILCIGLFFLSLGRGAGAVEFRMQGDIDGDTRVTMTDVVLCLRAAVRLAELDTVSFDAADLSPAPGVGPRAGQDCGNGIIDVNDAIEAIRQVINPSANLLPTFVNIQREVFNESCAFSSCHGSTGKRGGLVLEEGKAYESLVNVRAMIDEGKPEARLRVAPGNPEGSFLLTKLNHPGPDDGEKMPMGTETGLAPSKIRLIRDWILRGAPNDGDLADPNGENKKVPVDPNYDDKGDVQLAPPPPGQGVQMVIPAFDVPKGKEIQRNYYMKLPVDEDVDIQKIEFAFNPGSHHLNIFKSDTEDYMEGTFHETFSAIDWQSWYLVVDSQNSSLGWQLPPGVAIRLKARQQMNFQIHYVNVGDQRTRNNRGKAIINFWFAKPGTVKSHMGALFGQNRQILLPPRALSEFSKVVTFPHDVKILAMTGHFHSRGKQFFVNRWDGKNVGEEVYRSLSWADPPFKIYDTPIDVKGGEGLIYTTIYYNDTDKPIKFGGQVDIEEHANLFVFFYPGLNDGKAIYQF